MYVAFPHVQRGAGPNVPVVTVLENFAICTAQGDHSRRKTDTQPVIAVSVIVFGREMAEVASPPRACLSTL